MTQQLFTPTAGSAGGARVFSRSRLRRCFLPQLPSPAFAHKPRAAKLHRSQLQNRRRRQHLRAHPGSASDTSRSARAGRPDGAPSDVGTPTIRITVNEVSLIFTVTDKHGHYIPNLNQSDFALLDDQKAPAQGELVSPADQSAAARGHRHRRQHLDPLPLSV